MKSEWKECKVGDYVSFQNGYAFKAKDFSTIGEYRVIKIKELKDGTIKFFSDTARINSGVYTELDKYKVIIGDVLFALTGDPVSKPNPLSWVGRVSIYPHKEISLLNQRVCKAIFSDDIVPLFFYYYFRQDEVFLELAGKATGSASQANISTKTISDTIIRIPDYTTQKRIAGILSTIDEKIALNTAINENLEQQAQALFKAWFVDFEPFGGIMPDDWIEKTLGDVTRNIRTKINNNNTPVFSAVNSGNLVYSDDYFNKQVYSKDISKYIRVDNWDFAYNPARINIGSIGINDLGVTGCVSPVYVVFSVQEEYHSFFRFFFRQEWFKQQSLTRASGSVRQTLNYSDFSLIDLVYPNIEYAKRFDVIWKSYYSVIERLREENSKLSELRDMLLPKLMNGEIDVSAVKI